MPTTDDSFEPDQDPFFHGRPSFPDEEDRQDPGTFGPPMQLPILGPGPTGIDVSAYQSEIDWTAVAGSGRAFAYIRLSFSRTTDKRAAEYWDGARRAGLVCGGYHFFRNCTPVARQVEAFLKIFDETRTYGPVALPPALDLEWDKYGTSLASAAARQEYVRCAREWLEAVQQAVGMRPVIYTGRSFWKEIGSPAGLEAFGLWVARPDATKPAAPPPWTDYRFWQYSHKGEVPGITTKVDLDVFHGTEAEFSTLVGAGSPGQLHASEPAPVNEDRYCFAWFKPKTSAGQDRAALLKEAKWPEGSIITVSFLDGDPTLQQRVIAAARLWTAHGLANVTFDFRKDTNATDIRISFRRKGSWSLIGTECRKEKNTSKPTMNFGWLTPESSDLDVREVVLHEFGHALGLIHEHQNPVNGIHWNKDVIYKELSEPPNEWDRATIDFNMFEGFSRQETNYTQRDDKSIMMYPFPKRWTTDGFSTGFNSELSETDKKFIRRMYP